MISNNKLKDVNSVNCSELLNEEKVPTFLSKVLDHLYIACPIIITFLLRKSVDIISAISVGHLGAEYLAAAGLASVTANVTGNSMIIGLSGALSTICSQSFGANDLKEMNISLQRSILILYTFICIPISILWMCSSPIMHALGQNEIIARNAQAYLICLIPNLWALSTTYCIQNWLYAQSRTKGIAFISLFFTLLHPLWLYLYIYKLQFGYIGAALAISTTKSLELIALLLYVAIFSGVLKEVKFEWSLECFIKWYPYLKLGIPNLLMMSEWWASEIIIFMSGSFSNPEVELSAMSIYQYIIALCFMAPAGFNSAAATIVGNALGAGKADIAYSSSIIAPGLTVMTSLLISACLLPFKQNLGRIFTTDKEVIKLVGTLVPVIVVYIISDGFQTALTGVIKGMGRQGIASPIVLVSYYIIGIPLSAYLAWGRGWDVFGLCIGTLAGTIMHMLCFITFVYGYTDWDYEVERLKTLNINITSVPLDAAPTLINSYKSAAVEEDDTLDEESWWDEINFLKQTDTVAVNRGKEITNIPLLNMFYRGLKWLTFATSTTSKDSSEYELVKTYTDSLSPLHMNDEDGIEEIDFEFI